VYKIVAIQPSTLSVTRFGESAVGALRYRPRLGCDIGPVSCGLMDWSVSLLTQVPKSIAVIMARLPISI
jgi:hypothetical protein